MRVVVAMSGGVDSSVAAALLVEAGHEVIGVHMRLHTGPEPARTTGHCCGVDDALDARAVADSLGIPFYVLDLADVFRSAVKDDFAERYVAGETPNPCVQCNGVLKFRVLLARAAALGASHLATGHYARIDAGPDGHELRIAADSARDQSYFLFQLRPAALARTLFPLGGLTKPEVRAHAARLGLGVAGKPDSQEVCFLPDDDHTRFVAEERPDLPAGGEIATADGAILGHHDAYYRFTIGQRRGLGVARGEPTYVLSIDPATRRVVVGPDAALWGSRLILRDTHWLARPGPERAVDVRIRHRGTRIPCHVGAGDDPEVALLTPARAITPGQAAVFYEGDRVLGGGFVTREAAA
jgi:tRNA-specific 2-thiouridylase